MPTTAYFRVDRIAACASRVRTLVRARFVNTVRARALARESECVPTCATVFGGRIRVHRFADRARTENILQVRAHV